MVSFAKSSAAGLGSRTAAGAHQCPSQRGSSSGSGGGAEVCQRSLSLSAVGEIIQNT
jgi:hypothetical protein